jgi:hypothetical protein
MTPGRTASGIRWIRRAVPEYEALDTTAGAEELLGHLLGAGAEAVFSLFYPLAPGQSRAINLWQSELAARHPEVIAFASVHAGDDNPGEIVEDALDRLDLAGLKLHPYVQKIDPLDPRLTPALTAASDRGRPCILHTGFSEWYGAGSLAGHIPRLADLHPDLKIVVAHLLYADLPLARWPLWLERHPNLYLDATNVLSLGYPGTADGDALAALLAEWSHRFTYGSDYPMGMAYPVEKLYRLPPGIAPHPEALEDLSWRTAARLVEPRRLPPALARSLAREPDPDL